MHAAGLFGMGVDIDRHESTLRREVFAAIAAASPRLLVRRVLWWNSGE
jgi:hypothetical protein